MSDRDVMVKRRAIRVDHGTLSTDYIIAQLGDVLDDRVADGGWRRVAAAVDSITRAPAQ